jgi:hypothetical protein
MPSRTGLLLPLCASMRALPRVCAGTSGTAHVASRPGPSWRMLKGFPSTPEGFCLQCRACTRSGAASPLAGCDGDCSHGSAHPGAPPSVSAVGWGERRGASTAIGTRKEAYFSAHLLHVPLGSSSSQTPRDGASVSPSQRPRRPPSCDPKSPETERVPASHHVGEAPLRAEPSKRPTPSYTHIRSISSQTRGSCTRTLRPMPLASKPGKMPPAHEALKGARPWSHPIVSPHSRCWRSYGSSSCI